METKTFSISGVKNINSAVKLRYCIASIKGVSNVSVDINSSKATVTYNPELVTMDSIKSLTLHSGFNLV